MRYLTNTNFLEFEQACDDELYQPMTEGYARKVFEQLV